MELSHLRYASVLAEEHNFSKAADRLFISQPTLSQQIHRLEDELGMKLFVRTTHSVSLTPYGEIFVSQANVVLQAFDKLDHTMKGLLESNNSVCSIGMLPSFASYGIPKMLSTFKVKYPQIKTKLTMEWSSQLIEMLCRHEIDIAFINADEAQLASLPDSIKVEPFLVDQIMLITSENYSIYSNKYVDINVLKDLPFLLPPKAASIHQLMEDMFKELDIEPTIVCVCTTIESLIHLVQNNVGVTIMSSSIAKQYPGIRMIPLRPAYHLQTCIAYNKAGFQNSAQRLFLDYLNSEEFKHKNTKNQ